MVFEHILVYAELTGAAEIYGYIRSDDLFDLPDSVIGRMWTIIDQLAFPESLLVPCAPVKRGDHREQIESIWQGFVQGRFPGRFPERYGIRRTSATSRQKFIPAGIRSPRQAEYDAGLVVAPTFVIIAVPTAVISGETFARGFLCRLPIRAFSDTMRFIPA